MVRVPPAIGLDKYAGTYILAPGKVNHKRHHNYGFYWINDKGTTALWYCDTCYHIRWLIGDFENLGAKSGTISGWYKNSPDWVYEWKYSKDGKWVATTGITVKKEACKNS